MKRKTRESLVDLSLTPENASEKGYTFIQEVINPYKAFQEILELAAQNGYYFGTSGKENDFSSKFGLYRQNNFTKKRKIL